MSLINGKNAVHAEVCLKQSEGHLQNPQSELVQVVRSYLENARDLPFNKTFQVDAQLNEALAKVESVMLECDAKGSKQYLSKSDLQYLVFHIYYPHQRGMESEVLENEGEADSAAVPSANHWILPSNAFVGLWENLIYENGLKEKLLKFALSALTFSKHHINQNIISCNRMILLHGPPGTGKTSLCKALAQKLAIRTRAFYRHTHLIEINSHSLFSKWFSESGKLVMRLFGSIRELIADKQSLVCVLIDEVESLAYARDNMSCQEPKDAMRVVNALLTQLDSIKEQPNVLVLATSNLANTIDLAFLDRADIKQHIGLPSVEAIKRIYETMLLELMQVGIVSEESLTAEDKHEGLLSAIAERSVGLSGRTLRKLPFLAHAQHAMDAEFGVEGKISLSDFLDNMLTALEQHQHDHNLMNRKD